MANKHLFPACMELRQRVIFARWLMVQLQLEYGITTPLHELMCACMYTSFRNQSGPKPELSCSTTARVSEPRSHGEVSVAVPTLPRSKQQS